MWDLDTRATCAMLIGFDYSQQNRTKGRDRMSWKNSNIFTLWYIVAIACQQAPGPRRIMTQLYLLNHRDHPGVRQKQGSTLHSTYEDRKSTL